MKAASSALITFLNSGTDNFVMANCYTITLLNGGVYRCTDVDVPVSYGGNTFPANLVQMSGLQYSVKRGVQVDEQDLTIAAETTDLIEGQPFLQALASGLLDDAHFQWDRAFLPAWGQPAIGTMDPLFYGRISTVDKLGRTQATVKVKSELVLLDKPYPARFYAATCQWTLFGVGCGLNPTSFSGSAIVASGTTLSTVNLSGASFTDGTPFAQGTITFTSGNLSGESATIQSWSNSPLSFTLTRPLPSVPSTGSSCTVNWGCDHTTGSQGCAKFSNTANFLGFPFVPPPSTGL